LVDGDDVGPRVGRDVGEPFIVHSRSSRTMPVW
jgi:hypothetical protein